MLKRKHLLLSVAAALTCGSFDTQSKMRQLRALRGKLRDGTIRGRKARESAMVEIEKLERELDASSDKEASSDLSTRSLKDDQILIRGEEVTMKSSASDEDRLLRGTKEWSVDCDERTLPGTSTGAMQSEAPVSESPRNSANQTAGSTLATVTELSANGRRIPSTSNTSPSPHSEDGREPMSCSHDAASANNLCEDETLANDSESSCLHDVIL